jgi:HTH-type transcriptional regulator/antitoxin HigA
VKAAADQLIKHLLPIRNTTRRSGRNDIRRKRLQALLSREKPEGISGERQNLLYIERLEKLTAKKSVTTAEKKLIALLTVLIEEYEAKHDPVPNAEPRAIVRHLMEAHNLRQKDLLDVFGTESIASEIVRGKRELTKQHIRRLSNKFNVSPAVFF